MIQTLLKERTRLAVHTEQQERPAWALVVWKGQNKMRPSEMPAKPEEASCRLNRDAAGAHLACQHLTMPRLCS